MAGWEGCGNSCNSGRGGGGQPSSQLRSLRYVVCCAFEQLQKYCWEQGLINIPSSLVLLLLLNSSTPQLLYSSTPLLLLLLYLYSSSSDHTYSTTSMGGASLSPSSPSPHPSFPGECRDWGDGGHSSPPADGRPGPAEGSGCGAYQESV